MNEAMEVDAGAGDDVVMDEDLEGSLSDDLSDDLEPTQEPTQRRPSMSEDEERKRRASIKAILADGNISETERRRSIQHLMDGRRNSRSGASTPTAIESDATPTNGNSNQETQQPVPSEDLLQGSLSQLNYVVTPVANEQTKRFELTRPECTHYDRQCTLIAPCCGAAFGCRICHDDCPVLPPKITVQQARRRYPRSSSLPSSFTNMNQTPEDTHHTIDRFAVREVICRNCYCRQSSKSNNCINCGIKFGDYHCSICNLWMSDDEKPYHCADCGFCRVGGAENFQHCHDCGMCIDRTLYDNHNCKVGKYKSNCPVCQEYLFSSRSASHEMPCGHAIHWDCFRQLAAHDSRCPVCKKTAETKERMMPTWNAMAAGVALQPVPPELARVVNIQCNDCEEIDYGRAWHFLGVQCRNCSSFNTVVDRIVMSGEEAHNFLEAMVQREQFSAPFDLDAPASSNSRRRVSRRRSHI
eukprot:CAMPEP_0178938122 /NCGR_PEP_ID=MMETSP0786-20121207/26157_1 /TAXON_ID=186022 /ORGANISM="Thalassionema frauenfeldii, Strain CCMP 1798" /LENGTH=468 /DNA_ID=CAMNT_0020616809 /DNA_START=73 /DNA_END=1479 /DNA_ORIENTATION=+